MSRLGTAGIAAGVKGAKEKEEKNTKVVDGGGRNPLQDHHSSYKDRRFYKRGVSGGRQILQEVGRGG